MGIMYDHFGDFVGFVLEDGAATITASKAVKGLCSRGAKSLGRALARPRGR